MTPLLHALFPPVLLNRAVGTTLLKLSDTLGPQPEPPALPRRSKQPAGPQDPVSGLRRFCLQCGLFSVCSAGPTAHCMSPDSVCPEACLRDLRVHRALALGFLWWLQWERAAEGAGCGKQVPLCVSSHPSASGLGGCSSRR